MSSILEALKKLEKAAPRTGGVSGRSGSPQLSAGPHGHHSSGRTQKLLLFGAAGILFLIAAAGAWYYFTPKPKTVQPVASTPQPASIQQPAQPAQSAPATVTAPKPKRIETRPKPRPSERGSVKSATVHRNTVDTPPARKAVETQPSKKAPSKPAQVAKPAKSTPSNTISPAALPKLEDAKIKLQAISWAEIAEKRMVVINSKILREGDTVDGYEVKRIGEEGVVLSKEGTSWRLSIRLK